MHIANNIIKLNVEHTKNITNTGPMPFYKTHVKLTFCVHLVSGKTAGGNKLHFLEYEILSQISTNPVGELIPTTSNH